MIDIQEGEIVKIKGGTFVVYKVGCDGSVELLPLREYIIRTTFIDLGEYTKISLDDYIEKLMGDYLRKVGE